MRGKAKMKILIIGDFHYKKMMYPPTVSDLSYILERGSVADIIIHTGDFCNDYLHSPELFRRLFADGRDVFGVFGNHELETCGNAMENVTPLITNAKEKAVFGTDSGTPDNEKIAYYYHDRDGYRFIFTDTNYSLSPDGEWEHNRTASWGAPSGNRYTDSLGKVQLEWLKRVIFDAAERGLKCITVSHATFCKTSGNSSPDAAAVREIFRLANEKRKGSVILAINGHYHTVGRREEEGVVYLDCPAAINGWWVPNKFYPYAEEEGKAPRYTFDYEEYDADGELLSVRPLPYSALRMGAQTLFYEKPVYTLLTLEEEGISADVSPMVWAYGIAP